MESEALRFKRNTIMFNVAYTMMGVMVGLLFGVYITYLSITSPIVASYYSVLLGLGFLGSAAAAGVAPKVGYKKFFVLTPVVMLVSMLLVLNVQNDFIIAVITFVFISFICLYDVMFAPYMAFYTDEEHRDSEINKTTIFNIIGATLGTFLGGPMIVWLMSGKLNISYSEASTVTESLETMNELQLDAYIAAHRQVIVWFVIFAALMIIPALFMKEKKEDFAAESEPSLTKEEKLKGLKIIFSKDPLVFMLFMSLINFGASLMTPYAQVYMLSVGISRDLASMIASLQYVVIFAGLVVLTPFFTKKFGQVNGMAISCLLSIPFMIICANGRFFGGATAILVAIGVCVRYTLYYTANPIMTAFETVVVPKQYVALYVSVTFICMSAANTLAGIVGGALLFNQPNGYSNAYYVGAAFFAAACILLLAALGKKYKNVKTDPEEAI